MAILEIRDFDRRLADYAYVSEVGSDALAGPAGNLHENDHVKRAYLGA